MGTKDALTGPIERNDVRTVEKHLNTFEGIDRQVYKTLSLKTLDVAKAKHPENNYSELELLLTTQED